MRRRPLRFGVYLLAALLSACESRTESALRATTGISDVIFYLNYEGSREAEVVLDNGGYIWMFRLRDEVFVDTDVINVIAIGDYMISCTYPGQIGSTSSGHNIIAIIRELTKAQEDGPSIRNVADLVDSYDSVLNLLQLLPPSGEEPFAVPFRERVPVQWYCNRVTYEPRQ